MDSCPNEVEAFRGEVKGLIERLMESLGKQYKDDAKVTPLLHMLEELY